MERVTMNDSDHHWVQGRVLRRGWRTWIVKTESGNVVRIPRSQVLFSTKSFSK